MLRSEPKHTAAIGKILTHLGLDPHPPPRGRASEAGHAFAAD